MIRWYPINEATGTTIYDRAGDQDGTAVNVTDDERELMIYEPQASHWVSADGLTIVELP